MEFLHAIFLGIVEGITEFLPVSSTGHLILLIDLLALTVPPGKVFEIVVQLGSILAVCWVYRVRLFGAVFHAHDNPAKRRFLVSIVVAFIPAALLGATFHGFIKAVLFDPVVVSVMLVTGGFAILAVERYKPQPLHHDSEALGWKLALKIGLCQTLGMIPGVSRAGATIMGAMLLKVDRQAATEFSFFLAIPTMAGATVYDLYKNWALLDLSALEVIGAGFFMAFVTSLVAVRALIAFVGKHGFAPFAYYRIALGSAMLVLLLG